MLEALGINLNLSLENSAKILEETGLHLCLHKIIILL